MAKILALLAALVLCGCAELPRHPSQPIPGLVIINDGINMGERKPACYVEESTNELRPCT